jgi:hypothetical protein
MEIILVASGVVRGLIGAVEMLEAVRSMPLTLHGGGCYGPNPGSAYLPEMVVAFLGIPPFWPVSKMRAIRALR